MALVRLGVVLSALLVLWPSTAAARQAGPPVATAEIRLDQPGAMIAPEIYGQFMEQLGTGIDGGVWVGPENSLRDGLLAAVNFNIFHRHANRVRMANVAQMVNVLQAVILTDGPRMVLTPTYHAFAMYQPFQGGTVLPLAIRSPDYVEGAVRLAMVDGTAAQGRDGRVMATARCATTMTIAIWA